jgi:hypothetical protein
LFFLLSHLIFKRWTCKKVLRSTWAPSSSD